MNVGRLTHLEDQTLPRYAGGWAGYSAYNARYIKRSIFDDIMLSIMYRLCFCPSSPAIPRKRIGLKTCEASAVHYPLVLDIVSNILHPALEDS